MYALLSPKVLGFYRWKNRLILIYWNKFFKKMFLFTFSQELKIKYIEYLIMTITKILWLWMIWCHVTVC